MIVICFVLYDTFKKNEGASLDVHQIPDRNSFKMDSRPKQGTKGTPPILADTFRTPSMQETKVREDGLLGGSSRMLLVNLSHLCLLFILFVCFLHSKPSYWNNFKSFISFDQHNNWLIPSVVIWGFLSFVCLAKVYCNWPEQHHHPEAKEGTAPADGWVKGPGNRVKCHGCFPS